MDDTTTPAVATSLEDSFLRTLITLPVAKILTIIDSLEPEDIYDPHHLLVLDAIVRTAHSQTIGGDGNRPVDPALVQCDLMRAGTLNTVKPVLLTVVTGDPAPVARVGDFAAGLRENRLRRACLTVGEALAQAGRVCGHADLARVLSHLPRLLVLARRAGLIEEVDK